MSHPRTRHLLLMALLACGVLAVYGQVYSHEFIEYDDPGYVRDNLMVRRGLSWDGIRWAFTTNHLGHWNPVTWLSHMLDVQLFGLNAGAHHLVNVALHLANTLLLFAVFQRMTRDPWPSFVVAALFALHPLHVESVAWIAERKDVLSTLFWFLTMWAYVRYTEARSPRWYGATLILFALGLMAKPMLVTLPFVLLLLDVWPLRRVSGLWSLVPGLWLGRTGTRSHRRETRDPRPALLFAEKLPLFALTALFSAVAYATQLQTGAIAKPALLPLGARVANALVSYAQYLVKAVWPSNLAILYPYDPYLPLWQPAAAAMVLALVSLLVLRFAGRRPWLAIGWLWYLGTLVPVIGLVQIGSQALADRYTYVPLVGLFVMVAWSGRALVGRWALPAPVVGALATVGIGAYAMAAWAQVGLWHTGESLLAHTVRVTRDNCIARNNLGVTLAAQGRIDEALEQYRAALRIKPDYADAHNNVALTLWRRGQRAEAVEHYRASLRAAPDVAETHNSLGLVLTELGQEAEGTAHIAEALRLEPELAGGYVHLGAVLSKSGRVDEAMAHFHRALQIDPENAAAYNNIGIVLAQQGKADAAIAQFRTALRYDPRSVDAWNNLGLALGQLAKTDEAVASFAEAVRLASDQADLRINLGTALRTAGRLPEAVGEYEHALQINPDSIAAHYQLGVALTQTGRNQDAIQQYEHVLRLNPDHAEAHNDLGVTLVNLHRLPEAITHFERALALDPGLGDARVNLDIARTMTENAKP